MKINIIIEIKIYNIMYVNIKIYEWICLGMIWIEIKNKERLRWLNLKKLCWNFLSYLM